MDARLRAQLKSIEEQIDELKKIDNIYLTLKAAEEPKWSLAFLSSEGKNVEERKARAYVTKDWQAFAKNLANAEAEFHRAKNRLALKMKAFDAEYLTLKIENEGIKRSGG
jgi:cysteine sulfinate desulfinase/cysteine desulfurase-like protein